MFDTELTPTDAVFGRVTYPAGGSLGPRRQTGLQLFLIEAGHAHLTLDGKRLRVDEGMCCLLTPGRTERFRFATDRPSRHSWVTMGLPAARFERMAEAPAPVKSYRTSSKLTQLIELGLQTAPAADGPSRELTLSLAVAAYHAFRVLIHGEHATPRSLAPPLDKACAYIDEHLPEPMSVGDLAEAAGVTPSHLSRLFKKHLGVPPSRYLWDRRTRRGHLLLQQTGLSVAEVAYEVGFATPYHFSRCIKTMYGQSPRSLRQNMR